MCKQQNYCSPATAQQYHTGQRPHWMLLLGWHCFHPRRVMFKRLKRCCSSIYNTMKSHITAADEKQICYCVLSTKGLGDDAFLRASVYVRLHKPGFLLRHSCCWRENGGPQRSLCHRCCFPFEADLNASESKAELIVATTVPVITAGLLFPAEKLVFKCWNWDFRR